MKYIIILLLFITAPTTMLIYGQSNITYGVSTLLDIGIGADVCADTVIMNGTRSGGGTICGSSLTVSFSSFNASVKGNNVTLSWTTEFEKSNSGFRIERKDIKENLWKEIWFIAGNGSTNKPHIYNYEDKKLNSSAYKYRIKQLDYRNRYEYHELKNEVVVKAPGSFSMGQNYPNPSNPKSRIDFELPEDGKVTLKLYDLLGQEILTLVNEEKEAGYYSIEFDGSNLSSGVYFYRLEAGRFSDVKKMMLVK